jgi:outer membrane protein assembly factor BamB
MPSRFQRLVTTIATGLLIAAAGPASAAAIDWPQFRFDDAHSGVNPFETTLSAATVPGLQQVFAAQLGTLVDFSSPAVVNGVAYIGSDDGRLWAYPADGCGRSLCTKPLWVSTSLAQIIDSPTVANGIVYVGSQTSRTSAAGKLNAFAASGCGQSSCAPLWQGLAGSQSILESSPTVANGVVYVGSYDGQLYAFDANGCGAPTCQPLWTAQTGGHIESTPTVFQGRVYVGSDDGRLHVFDAAGCGSAQCSDLWTGAVGGPIFESSPAIVDGVVYIASQHSFAAFDANGCGMSSCNPLWRSIEKTTFFNGSPAVAEGHVFMPLENAIAVYAVGGCGKAVCDPLWQLLGAGEQADILSSPTVANGVVYAGRNTGQILAWKTAACGRATCQAIWSATVNEPIVSSSPTVVNGRLYIGSADDSAATLKQGRLYVFGLR